MNYHEPLYRPPAEGDSLIFQVSVGCPHNSCRFCPMYKGFPYKSRELADILSEVEWASIRFPRTRRVFLADGDAMATPFDKLRTILSKICDSFPLVTRINAYANGTSLLNLSDIQLEALRELKLNTLYIGLESGSQDVLDLVGKKEEVKAMVEAVQRCQGLGMKASVMVLLGLAGKKLSAEHISRTAEALNIMQPRLLSALRFVEAALRAPMFPGYQTLSEHEILLDLRNLIASIELEKTVFRANHSSNPLPIGGRLPHDKTTLLRQVQGMIDSGEADTEGPGRLPFWL